MSPWSLVAHALPRTKCCSRCKKWLSLENFNKNRNSRDGRDHRCRDCNKIYVKEYALAIKKECIEAYGGKCVCPPCGETNIHFLTMEHQYNDGAKHRREITHLGRRKGGGARTYMYLRKRGYPKDLGLQVMCYNCNCGRWVAQSDVCPHLF